MYVVIFIYLQNELIEAKSVSVAFGILTFVSYAFQFAFTKNSTERRPGNRRDKKF